MRQTVLQKVMEYNKKYHMLQEGDCVLVGLSGGADSVCLLHILQEVAKQIPISICALHVNHGIRGEAAEQDEQFTRALCAECEIPFFSIKEDVPDYAQKNRVSLEEAGRILRYAALERIKQEQGCTKIALAHHANDSAETMLFHLFRGGKLSALAGIPPVRGDIIRPLLCCSRSEIEAWLAERNAAYCTDSSNFSETYTRNKIRHRVIAYAEKEINPKAVMHMQQTAEYMRQVKEFVEQETKKLFEKTVQKTGEAFQISVPAFSKAPVFLQQQLVHKVLAELGGAKDVTDQHVTNILSLLGRQSGKGVDIPGGIRAERSYHILWIGKKQEGNEHQTVLVTVPGQYLVKKQAMCTKVYSSNITSDGAKQGVLRENSDAFLVFSVFPYENTMKIPKNRYTKWFDYDRIKDDIILRKKQQGDVIRLENGTKTLKAFFIHEKIPKDEREQMMLVACGKEILWIPGVRNSSAYLVEESTERILQIELKPANHAKE